MTVLGVEPARSARAAVARQLGLSRETAAETIERERRQPGSVGVLSGSSLRSPSVPGWSATAASSSGATELPAIELGAADPRRPTVLARRCPRARGAHGSSIELIPPRLLDRGADAGIALRGATTLRVLGASLRGWIGDGGRRPRRPLDAGPGLRLAYAVTAQRHAVCAAPADGRRSAGALVTPALGELAGGVGGTFPLRIGGEPVNVRVGAVVGGSPGRRATRSSPTSARSRTAVDTRRPVRRP